MSRIQMMVAVGGLVLLGWSVLFMTRFYYQGGKPGRGEWVLILLGIKVKIVVTGKPFATDEHGSAGKASYFIGFGWRRWSFDEMHALMHTHAYADYDDSGRKSAGACRGTDGYP